MCCPGLPIFHDKSGITTNIGKTLGLIPVEGVCTSPRLGASWASGVSGPRMREETKGKARGARQRGFEAFCLARRCRRVCIRERRKPRTTEVNSAKLKEASNFPFHKDICHNGL